MPPALTLVRRELDHCIARYGLELAPSPAAGSVRELLAAAATHLACGRAPPALHAELVYQVESSLGDSPDAAGWTALAAVILNGAETLQAEPAPTASPDPVLR
ncbi:MAG: hypothetical protein J7598_03480 [Mitsuaria chitosanitabida]|nr:hypothetical protein [Roseateles chitosanitabidus]